MGGLPSVRIEKAETSKASLPQLGDDVLRLLEKSFIAQPSAPDLEQGRCACISGLPGLVDLISCFAGGCRPSFSKNKSKVLAGRESQSANIEFTY